LYDGETESAPFEDVLKQPSHQTLEWVCYYRVSESFITNKPLFTKSVHPALIRLVEK
jgi:hypothetical protein